MRDEIKAAVNKVQQHNDLWVDGGFATYVDGLSELWIPSEESAALTKWHGFGESHHRITEACLVLGIHNLLEGGLEDWQKIKGLWYSVPERLQRDLVEGNDPDILVNGSEGFQRSLLRAGWRWKVLKGDETQKLVKEFLALARLPLKKAGQAVREFVLRWGPLWLCAMHTDCCWSPRIYSSANPFNLQLDCRWFPSEPIVVFLAKAKQAEAAIEITGFLSENQPAPIEYWQTLNGQVGVNYTTHFPDGRTGSLSGKGEADLLVQKNHLIQEINRFLTIANGPTFRLSWPKGKGHPVMRQDTGLGFYRLVWMQIAQTLCGGKGIYKCDGCSRYYVPERKPPAGRNHFCFSCGGANQRAAKKLWIRKRRKGAVEQSR